MLPTCKDVAAGAEAAKQCAIQVLAQVQNAVGSLDRVVRLVKLTGFVNTEGAFEKQPQVRTARFFMLCQHSCHLSSPVVVACARLWMVQVSLC